MSTVKLEKSIKAPPAEIYHYFTSSTALRDWMCDVATATAQPGGHLYMCWSGEYYTSGEYLELKADKSISFTWFGKGEPHKTRVDVTLKGVRGGTLVKLAHRGMGKGQKWESITKVYQKEWQSALENLASVTEAGPDLRITRRPMLGIYLGDFDASIAKKLGCPVDFGSRLDGVVEGMGAAKVGLQKDDVIIAVDGHELIAGTTLGTILGTKHAGDVVEVTFYRGADKLTANMTLSGRPIPTIPASYQELSKEVEKQYRQSMVEIETAINGVSEAQCAHQPNPKEWSVNDILAHLIQSEVGWQNRASEIISGTEGAYDEYSGNLQSRIDATLSIYPTKASLITQLKAVQAETVIFLASVPADFLVHKGRFWKLVYEVAQNPYHMQSHLEQIQKALQAVKA
ncbi:MAG: hypothetical protein C3F13_09710 [Anaerolineales bacterium]|nr:PDZ domain-containing protein [Anaerolineae bacterium]PWB53239.1 MAG: hypothetical protein C3F13_09710 [Anaerolineales bacterium]